MPADRLSSGCCVESLSTVEMYPHPPRFFTYRGFELYGQNELEAANYRCHKYNNNIRDQKLKAFSERIEKKTRRHIRGKSRGSRATRVVIHVAHAYGANYRSMTERDIPLVRHRRRLHEYGAKARNNLTSKR
ncbi:hypothetical protein EVAR_41652_1 [Eumeta japonica]|uniref:Uncharacterized protein n=1 Tax=Eumeta variegata TaxID=151549 RepID=A0A4C1X165_EUMVA|nr:hypothetical protein EVAR_41652_1 [Eumeta japonica]